MHRRTDPKCAEYRPPRTLLAMWKHDLASGKVCVPCIADRQEQATTRAAERAARAEDARAADADRATRYEQTVHDLNRYTP